MTARRLAEALMPPVETERQMYDGAQERARPPVVHPGRGFARTRDVNDPKEKIPPAVLSNQPDKELEEKLKKHPEDPNAKVDVGSDESMDASDPPAAAQPGSADDPAPSSGFPEGQDR